MRSAASWRGFRDLQHGSAAQVMRPGIDAGKLADTPEAIIETVVRHRPSAVR
jgi:hypothetical protein